MLVVVRSLDQHFWYKSFHWSKTALKRWTVNNKCWNKNAVSRTLLVQTDIRQPSWLKKSVLFELIDPSVLKAIGMKLWVWANDWYFISAPSGLLCPLRWIQRLMTWQASSHWHHRLWLPVACFMLSTLSLLSRVLRVAQLHIWYLFKRFDLLRVVLSLIGH